MSLSLLRLVAFGTFVSSASACSNNAWNQCGGNGWSGETCCPAGHSCTVVGEWWHSCQPVAGATPSPTPDPTNAPTLPPVPTPDPTPAPTLPPVPTPDPTAAPTADPNDVLSGNLMYANNAGTRATWTPTYITKDTFGELRENDANKDSKKLTYYAGEAAASLTGKGSGNCAYSNVQNLGAFTNVNGWVALSKAKRYENSMACGMCVQYRGLPHVVGGVSNPIPTTWQKAIVVDSCPACEEGQKELVEIDLADSNGDGNWKIEWQSVECDTGSEKFQYSFEGSNDWAIKIQIRNTKVPIYKVEMKGRKNVLDVTHADAEYKYYEMRRSDDNHFRADSGNTPNLALHWQRPYGKYVGAVAGSEWGTYEAKLELRITSIFGEQVEESVDFTNGEHLKTLSYTSPITGTVQFDDGASFGSGRRLSVDELMAPHW